MAELEPEHVTIIQEETTATKCAVEQANQLLLRHVKQYRDEADRLRHQILAISRAVFKEPGTTIKKGDYCWSQAFEDVTKLREEYDKLNAVSRIE
jgi:hypothetical protein